MPSKFNGVSGQGIKMLTEWNFVYENISLGKLGMKMKITS